MKFSSIGYKVPGGPVTYIIDAGGGGGGGQYWVDGFLGVGGGSTSGGGRAGGDGGGGHGDGGGGDGGGGDGDGGGGELWVQAEHFSSADPGIVKTTITRNKFSSHSGLNLKGCIFVGKLIEASLVDGYIDDVNLVSKMSCVVVLFLWIWLIGRGWNRRNLVQEEDQIGCERAFFLRY